MRGHRLSSSLSYLLLPVTFLILCLTLGYFLNNDFWQDEVYTLEHFVFVPWKTVLTDYHSTNNHILFSATVKAVSSLFGITSMYEAMERPYLVRLVPFLFTILSVLFFYLNTKKHYGREFAITGTSVLCTSILFIDFGIQLRGYSLSIFLSIVNYFIFLKVIKQRPGRGLLLLFETTLLYLLCLPTNIIFGMMKRIHQQPFHFAIC